MADSPLASCSPSYLLAFTVLLALFPRGSHGNFYGHESYVTVLTDENFDEELLRRDGVAWLVEFYADWCHACNALRPTWQAVAEAVHQSRSHSGTCRVGAVSCEDYPTLCRSQQVPAYPELRYYPAIPGKPPVTYHGFMFPLAVVEWVEMLLGPIEHLEERIQDNYADLIEGPNPAANASGGRSTTAEGEADRNANRPSIISRGLKVTVSDMASSVMHALEREVFKSIEAMKSRKREVLLDFLLLLETRFPFEHNRESFTGLRRFVEENPSINPRMWERAMASFRIGSLNKDRKQWPYCNGIRESDPSGNRWKVSSAKRRAYRGSQGGAYPCGLWLLFHTLSVRTPIEHAKETNVVIARWVREFFGCRSCVQHFERTTGVTKASYKSPWRKDPGAENNQTGPATAHNPAAEVRKREHSWIFRKFLGSRAAEGAVASEPGRQGERSGRGQEQRAHRNANGRAQRNRRRNLKPHDEQLLLPDGDDVPPVLWAWAIHNKVNLRLHAEGSRRTRRENDASSAVYPSVKECPRCRIRESDAALDYNRAAQSGPVSAPQSPQLESQGSAESQSSAARPSPLDRETFRKFGILWDAHALLEYLGERYCLSGPPDDAEKDSSQVCTSVANKLIPHFRKRHALPGRAAVYIIAAFVGSLLVVSIGSCVCANLQYTALGGDNELENNLAPNGDGHYSRLPTIGEVMEGKNSGTNNTPVKGQENSYQALPKSANGVH